MCYAFLKKSEVWRFSALFCDRLIDVDCFCWLVLEKHQPTVDGNPVIKTNIIRRREVLMVAHREIPPAMFEMLPYHLKEQQPEINNSGWAKYLDLRLDLQKRSLKKSTTHTPLIFPYFWNLLEIIGRFPHVKSEKNDKSLTMSLCNRRLFYVSLEPNIKSAKPNEF